MISVQYLRFVRTLKYYGYLIFKACTTDYPQPDTRVVVATGNRELNFRLQLKVELLRSVFSACFVCPCCFLFHLGWVGSASESCLTKTKQTKQLNSFILETYNQKGNLLHISETSASHSNLDTSDWLHERIKIIIFSFNIQSYTYTRSRI